MTYLAVDGDAERSDGRSSSPNSYQGSRYASTHLVGLYPGGIDKLIGRQATVFSGKERGGNDWSSQLE